ncbi:HEAT repeat domain-containing protein [Gloeobacter kilaueensis]|uniref:Oxidoreductase/HEAT repeat-containing protein n=1 Tax=Gloeobacter kilaueensis (strain ATCC BAA-2537 / CCAP 1431/1 / ULC 316 / JS1) TaxID=1183438 RepID=U5QGR3_GLOK1|nr:HEAT repeat domain-containing protein [Gloeobacter kilaueensis]AGY56820.1 oxidoreductase/HEAT repeat-containing protein [Gloeobacter kilaueensis JS1]
MDTSLETVREQLASTDPSQRMRALVALRFFSDEEAVPLLYQAIQDPIPLVRVYAAIGLGKKKGKDNFDLLTQLLNNDRDPSVRAEAAGSLGSLGDLRAVDYLLRAYYEDIDWIVRYSAVVSLGQLRDERGYTVLRDALTSATDMIRDAAISALGELSDSRALDVLLPLVSNSDPEVRRRVAQALGLIATEQCRAPLSYLSRDDDKNVAEFARYYLENLDEKPKTQ